MINTAQRRFAPMVIGIDWNGDRHQIGISDRHRWNTQLTARGKNKNQTVIAVGRELLGFMWAIGVRTETKYQKQAA